MRPRIILILVAAVGVVTVICELESVAAVNRWDPANTGRVPQLSSYLWPKEIDSLPADEYALITVRVETADRIRTYRYRVLPMEDEVDDLLMPLDMDGDEDLELAAEPDPTVAHAGQ
jgi:hypothetical protein